MPNKIKRRVDDASRIVNVIETHVEYKIIQYSNHLILPMFFTFIFCVLFKLYSKADFTSFALFLQTNITLLILISNNYLSVTHL